MIWCLYCRPSFQPYVMASEVTKSGTSNGYPMKAQLQIVGKSLVCIKVTRSLSEKKQQKKTWDAV